ncbi:hypothetical protein [uncultured Methanomethylovorans sp.]|uniref:hypothetical protein n=1 Tax=uncultured Methanomethylovorans sp. TaxID=183759 RepID=UPI002AA67AB1|nr:hypothetical protein [uncultured Methanomethylovorans sp.]
MRNSRKKGAKMPLFQENCNGKVTLTIPKNIVDMEKLNKEDNFRIVKVQGYLALEPI